MINGRGVAKSPCAAFGGEVMEGSEDTSRSARRLPPPGPLLLPNLAPASIAVAGHGDARGAGYTLHALHGRHAGHWDGREVGCTIGAEDPTQF